MTKQKRRIKLIEPKLQIQLTMIFVGLSSLALLMQFVLFQSMLSELALQLPSDGALLMQAQTDVLPRILGVTLLAIIPLTYIVGVLSTFRIAGPVHRMKVYLRAASVSGYTEPCRLRKGDKLVELAHEISTTVERLSKQGHGALETDVESSAAREVA